LGLKKYSGQLLFAAALFLHLFAMAEYLGMNGIAV